MLAGVAGKYSTLKEVKKKLYEGGGKGSEMRRWLLW